MRNGFVSADALYYTTKWIATVRRVVTTVVYTEQKK